MHCPLCHNLLQQLDVTTNHGKKFSVDHCGRCGGTWFDPYQIHRIPFHEVVRLAHITVLPKTPRMMKNSLLCPSCNNLLEPLAMDGKSSGTQLMRCQHCHGVWATQKAMKDLEQTQTDDMLSTIASQKLSPYKSVQVVFAPVLFVLVLLYATFLTISSLGQNQITKTNATSEISPVQIRSELEGNIFITFQTKSVVRSEIHFGTSFVDMATLPISIAPQTTHHQFIAGLKPHTKYFYTITTADESNNQMSTNADTFTTI